MLKFQETNSFSLLLHFILPDSLTPGGMKNISLQSILQCRVQGTSGNGERWVQASFPGPIAVKSKGKFVTATILLKDNFFFKRLSFRCLASACCAESHMDAGFSVKPLEIKFCSPIAAQTRSTLYVGTLALTCGFDELL